MMQGIKNKKVLITAGATGIGKATAIALLNAGAQVHVCDIDAEALAQLKQLHPLLLTSVTNVAEPDEVAKMFVQLQQEFLGQLDFLVNNAGVSGPAGPLESLDIDAWKATFDVNLHATFYVSKHAIPLIKLKGGAIMNLSSTAGLYGYPMRSPYASAKWAIVGLSKTMAMELGPFNVRVNCICPGSVNGARMDRVISSIAKATGESVEKVRQDNVQNTSMTTFVDAEDIANMIVFSFSDLGAKISGQSLTVDGDTHSLATY
ncbi:MAG: SDR family oxidoreductase [Oceanospirillaceae bacterium]|nr:SDR family oxidoreductase [Oceanospirillaceae bacterium]MBT4998041.1 SDR family oxidoreductase [Oceanospirillaceae bacterium]MBT5630941.1 SDR family oxidoreductase [Oceanospirillaceae bacterium]MBT6099909.1 SDR family oxidoreductase [Oceanospirillaceae bacterium]MBT7674965.1 SDR family oxidoreductase [Oceanospirillaceae bacterium]